MWPKYFSTFGIISSIVTPPMKISVVFVRHEVSFVQLPLVPARVLIEIIGIAFGYVDHRGSADQRIHRLAKSGIRAIQVTEPLFDQHHALGIEIAEYGVLHAIRFDA